MLVYSAKDAYALIEGGLWYESDISLNNATLPLQNQFCLLYDALTALRMTYHYCCKANETEKP